MADAPPSAPSTPRGGIGGGKKRGSVQALTTCESCGANYFAASPKCTVCGYNPLSEEAPAEPNRPRRRSEVKADAEELDDWTCVYCAIPIGDAEEFCPLVDEDDTRGDQKGPKAHPACFEALVADMDTRCRWCFKPVSSVNTAPRSGFVPNREVDSSKYGKDGFWGRGHVENAPKGGAAGSTYGAGKITFHQHCVDKFNEAKGNKCIHCKRPIHVGLDIPGRGMVHKGFCHNQILKEDEEERKRKEAEAAERQKAEFVCVICGKEVPIS